MPSKKLVSAILKTGIKHAPLFPPRPAYSTTGAAQEDPAEANTPHPPTDYLVFDAEYLVTTRQA